MKENVNNGSIHLIQVLEIKGKDKKNGYHIIILKEVYQTEKDKYSPGNFDFSLYFTQPGIAH